MLKKSLFILLLFISIPSYAFFSKTESQAEICQNYIYQFLNNKIKFRPSIEEVRATLGNRTNNIAYTHTYHWYTVTVTFLNDKYVEHHGNLYVDLDPEDYHKITPEHVVKYHGKPIKIEETNTILQKWRCKRGISELEILLSKNMQPAKYSGRYCSQTHSKYCRYFEYSNN